jgi:hypothetical protein
MHVGPRRVLVNLRATFSGPTGGDVVQAVARLRERLGEIDGGLLDVTIEPVAAPATDGASDEGQMRAQRPSR